MMLRSQVGLVGMCAAAAMSLSFVAAADKQQKPSTKGAVSQRTAAVKIPAKGVAPTATRPNLQPVSLQNTKPIVRSAGPAPSMSRPPTLQAQSTQQGRIQGARDAQLAGKAFSLAKDTARLREAITTLTGKNPIADGRLAGVGSNPNSGPVGNNPNGTHPNTRGTFTPPDKSSLPGRGNQDQVNRPGVPTDRNDPNGVLGKRPLPASRHARPETENWVDDAVSWVKRLFGGKGDGSGNGGNNNGNDPTIVVNGDNNTIVINTGSAPATSTPDAGTRPGGGRRPDGGTKPDGGISLPDGGGVVCPTINLPFLTGDARTGRVPAAGSRLPTRDAGLTQGRSLQNELKGPSR